MTESLVRSWFERLTEDGNVPEAVILEKRSQRFLNPRLRHLPLKRYSGRLADRELPICLTLDPLRTLEPLLEFGLASTLDEVIVARPLCFDELPVPVRIEVDVVDRVDLARPPPSLGLVLPRA